MLQPDWNSTFNSIGEAGSLAATLRVQKVAKHCAAADEALQAWKQLADDLRLRLPFQADKLDRIRAEVRVLAKMFRDYADKVSDDLKQELLGQMDGVQRLFCVVVDAADVCSEERERLAANIEHLPTALRAEMDSAEATSADAGKIDARLAAIRDAFCGQNTLVEASRAVGELIDEIRPLVPQKG